MYSLVEMLKYKRPEGSKTQRLFCERFLEPHFGKPDVHGNYVLIIGDKPNICFTAHHDTVHKEDGLQKLVITNDIVSIADPKSSNCLGADCTTGVWILLEMIDNNIDGVYVVHAAEESGCRGSSNLILDNPSWLKDIDAVISFDRYGDNSIITHQMSSRTASDEFAKSFSTVLNMPQLVADTYGSYTDSNEYADIVSECTNISVGYYGQHGVNETQDLEFVNELVIHLVCADWSQLVFKRDPSVVEWCDDYRNYYYGSGVSTSFYDDDYNYEDIKDLVLDYPEDIAKWLDDLGMTAPDIMEQANIQDMNRLYKYM